MKTAKTAAVIAAALLSGSLMAETVFTVNGIKIDSKDLDRRAQQTIANSQGQIQDSPDLRRFIANQTIVETVVVQAAKKQHLDKSADYKAAEAEALKQARAEGADKQPDFKQAWADYQNQLLMQAYALDAARKNPVTDAQVQQRYGEIKQRYDNTPEVQIGEIITDTAERDLKAQKSFAETARKYSIDPEIKAGASPISDFVALKDIHEARPQIYAAVSGLNKGQHSKPISGDNLHALYYIHDKRTIKIDPLEKIQEALRASMANERVQETLDKLMQSAKIEPAK